MNDFFSAYFIYPFIKFKYVGFTIENVSYMSWMHYDFWRVCFNSVEDRVNNFAMLGLVAYFLMWLVENINFSAFIFLQIFIISVLDLISNCSFSLHADHIFTSTFSDRVDWKYHLWPFYNFTYTRGEEWILTLVLNSQVLSLFHSVNNKLKSQLCLIYS